MARVTVEDCLDKVDNRFQLVLLATKRARVLERHREDAKVDWDNDKPTVVALREIAGGQITAAYIHEKVREDRYTIERPQTMVIRDEDIGEFEDGI